MTKIAEIQAAIEAAKSDHADAITEKAALVEILTLVEVDAHDRKQLATVDKRITDISRRLTDLDTELQSAHRAELGDVPEVLQLGGALADLAFEMRQKAKVLIDAEVALVDVGVHDNPGRYQRLYAYPEEVREQVQEFTALTRRYCELRGHPTKHHFERRADVRALWQRLGGRIEFTAEVA